LYSIGLACKSSNHSLGASLGARLRLELSTSLDGAPLGCAIVVKHHGIGRLTIAPVLTLNVQFSLKARGCFEKLPAEKQELENVEFLQFVNGRQKLLSARISLSQNTTIQELQIDTCKLSPGQCTDLGNLIRTSRSLKLLNLLNLNLGNAATEIAKALESNCGLLCQ
jgi:hypothetical protein